MARGGDYNRDGLGRFTSGNYKRELEKQNKNLSSFIVPPDAPSNSYSGLSAKSRRTMARLDKAYFKSKPRIRKSNMKKVRNILRKY